MTEGGAVSGNLQFCVTSFMDDPLRTILVGQIFEQTWQSNFRCCHGVGDRDVKLNVELVLLQVDDVPAFAEPTGSFFVRLKPKPEIQPKKGFI